MNITLTHLGRPVRDYRDLLSSYPPREFASPLRSTIPLLAYWFNPGLRLPLLANFIGKPLSGECRLEFEYKVEPPRGRGNASHTDLMVTWEGTAVAIEAKYTEPPYPTVAQWLEAGSNRGNRTEVLQGWCDLIARRTGLGLSESLLPELTYQAVHRLASLCSRPEKDIHLLYLVFGPDPDQQVYYQVELMKLARALGDPRAIPLSHHFVSLTPTRRYQDLIEDWRAHRSDTRPAILEGLADNGLMRFY